MSTILLLECSPHSENSLGTQLVRELVDRFQSPGSDVRVVTRNLVHTPLPVLSDRYAQAVTTSCPRTDEAFACSELLIAELEQSDCLLISTPMHNFTVPAVLKLWIDYVLRINRSFKATPAGKVGLLKDRPTLVLVRSGGPCTGDAARQPDFLTPYLRHVLLTLGIHSADFLYLPGLRPASDELEAIRDALARQPLLSSLPGEYS